MPIPASDWRAFVIRHPLLELLAGLATPLVALVLVDFAWLRSGQSVLLEAVGALVWVTAAVVTPIVFWRLLRRSLPRSDTVFRWATVAVLTVICSLAWFFVGFTLFVNIHLAMGGPL